MLLTMFGRWLVCTLLNTNCPDRDLRGSSHSIYLWLYNPCEPWALFQFLNLHSVGSTPWTGDQPVARPLPTQTTTQTQNKRTQTSMPRVGFEPTILVFERPKTVHASDRAVTVTGWFLSHTPGKCILTKAMFTSFNILPHPLCRKIFGEIKSQLFRALLK
jgi:hypothetical protein